MRIAVAGGTGVIGRRVVDVLTTRGHEAVPLSRGTGVDLVTGAGLATRLDGVDVVIDTVNTASGSSAATQAFFTTVSTNLLAAEQAAGVGHHLALSVVGADDVAMAHQLGKRAQEKVVAGGEVPWTIQRVTQFHEFAQQVLAMLRVGPVSVVPQMRCRPVAAVEAAARLVDLAEAGPQGWVPEYAGPEERQMVEMARTVSRRLGLRRLVVGLPLPGAGRAMATGALLPTGDGPRGSITFERWLDDLASGEASAP